jgi:DNA-binding CsgD family transcriptional regulator
MVPDYQAGAKIKDLAARYRINRSTVFGHINRTGVRRHYPALVSEEIMEATQLYQSGRSLAAIGRHLGVNASTIRTALLRAGVAMRDCQGRER